MYTADTKSNRSNLKYQVDWNLLTVDFLPDRMRKNIIVNFISVINGYIDLKWFEFLNYRYNTLLETSVNGQTIVLQKYLNMIFDPIDQEIVITNTASNFETLYVYNRNEQPSAGDDIYIYRKGETIPPSGNQEYVFRKSEIELNVDFTVDIPSSKALFLPLNQITAIVNKYNFISTTFALRII